MLSSSLALGVLALLLSPASAQLPHDVPQGGRQGLAVERPVQPADSIPLPQRGTARPGRGGDEVLLPPSGDPHVLGFLAGLYAPPAGELVDPALLVLTPSFGDGRPTAATYAFVLFERRITPARQAILASLGCDVLGYHPHHALRVRVPLSQLLAVSELDFVRWIGPARPWQKLHPALHAALAAPTSDELHLHVSVFESDLCEASEQLPIGRAEVRDPGGVLVLDEPGQRPTITRTNGWMQAVLEARGAYIERYSRTAHAFTLRLPRGGLEALTALDFVQFVEPVPQELLLGRHDESTGMTHQDLVRATWNGGVNEVAIVAVHDSGIDVAHDDLDLFGIGYNCTGTASPWTDQALGGMGHGTPVTGTLLGRGVSEPDQRGAAPGLGWGPRGRLWNIRRFPAPCIWGLDTVHLLLSSPFTDPFGNTTERPHVVNNSWGSHLPLFPPSGTELDAREIDLAVFNHGQLHVYAAGDTGPSGGSLSIQASAKNALTVGAVSDHVQVGALDPGSLLSASSLGPAMDGRWKPNVSAPGGAIRSPRANDPQGYTTMSGSSLAAPHVTALAASLIDHFPVEFDYEPHQLAAHLMGSANTPGLAEISLPADLAASPEGAGRVQAYKAHFSAGGGDWRTWGVEADPLQSYQGSFDVPTGATRLVVVMHYVETAASAGASIALINDWDLWLDEDPIDPAPNAGEYFSHQSGLDNTEIRILDNPNPGPWAWKAFPQSVISDCRIGVSIFWYTEDTTPAASLAASISATCAQPGQPITISATLEPTEYLAHGALLTPTTTDFDLLGSTLTLGDGTPAEVSDNASGGEQIVLGEILASTPETGTWTVSYSTEGLKTFGLEARAENIDALQESVQVLIDGTPPTDPGFLTAVNAQAGTWITDPSLEFFWLASQDALSGLAGYSGQLSSSATLPSPTLNLGPLETSFITAPLPSSADPVYFNLRAVDACWNWSSTFTSAGPYFVDMVAPGAPSLNFTSHPIGIGACAPIVRAGWTEPLEQHSGLAGYSFEWSAGPGVVPDATVDTTLPEASELLGTGTWFLHVRAIDVAGNVGPAVDLGPFEVTAACGQNYCTAVANSTGSPGLLIGIGSDTVADQDFSLLATSLPQNQFGYFLVSASTGFQMGPGGTQGNLCLGSPLGRFTSQLQNSGGAGEMAIAVNLASLPLSPTAAVQAGETWNFQAWYRDFNPVPTSNFTVGLSVTFR